MTNIFPFFFNIPSECIVLSFAGAIACISFSQKSSKNKEQKFAALINVIFGTLIASVSVPALFEIAEYYWKLPNMPFFELASHLWFGIVGVKLVPVSQRLAERLSGIKLPGVDL